MSLTSAQTSAARATRSVFFLGGHPTGNAVVWGAAMRNIQFEGELQATKPLAPNPKPEP